MTKNLKYLCFHYKPWRVNTALQISVKIGYKKWSEPFRNNNKYNFFYFIEQLLF